MTPYPVPSLKVNPANNFLYIPSKISAYIYIFLKMYIKLISIVHIVFQCLSFNIFPFMASKTALEYRYLLEKSSLFQWSMTGGLHWIFF